MYKGYQIQLSNTQFEKYSHIGENIYINDRENFRQSLSKHTNKFGNIDVTSLETEWFPMVEADIFISHSGKDKKIVFGLMGWIKENFGLTVFVDSAIWGNSNELLKEIDDKYCLNENGETYSYDKRNESTSHVHMILSMALTKMIDKSECIMFCRTPNSLPYNHSTLKTDSPWIYSEITATQLLRRKSRNGVIMHKNAILNETFSAEQRASFEYELPLSAFDLIDSKVLNEWKEKHSKSTGIHGLDILYNL